jgi:hypothetical protein
VSQHGEESYHRRIAELEAEVARLKNSLEVAKTERKELRERLYGPVKEEDLPTEAEYLEMVKNHVPGSGSKLLERLGLKPKAST